MPISVSDPPPPSSILPGTHVREDVSAASGVYRALRPLLAPIPASGARMRERSELLAALTLVQATFAALGAIQGMLFAPSAIAAALPPILLATTAGDLVAYALARCARNRASAWATVATQWMTPLAIHLGLPGGHVP